MLRRLIHGILIGLVSAAGLKINSFQVTGLKDYLPV